MGHATNKGYAQNNCKVDHRQQNGNQFDYCQQNENQFDCWPAIGANWCTIVNQILIHAADQHPHFLTLVVA